MRKNTRNILLAACVPMAAMFFSTANADQPSWDAFTKGVGASGCSFRVKLKSKPVTVEMVCDEQQVIQSLPVLQKMGMMNPDITQTMANMYPEKVVLGYMVQITPAAVSVFYKDHHVNMSKWATGIVVPDLYGHPSARVISSFRFDRKTFNRIEWDAFPPQNFPSVAPGFQYSEYVQKCVLLDECPK